jgi:hypothetical protein
MSKVLALHNKTVEGGHWYNSAAYGRTQIDAIADPTAGQTHIAPTSIPSPFAHIDLVRAAFHNMTKGEKLESGTLIDFKLVSDCLDLGEIFFHYDRFKDKIKVITWDKNRDLNHLLQSKNIKHRRLGEVLKLYLEQDAAAYNFRDFDKMFILEYNHRIIGGTSPSTLFFTSANDLSFIDITMSNHDRLFDKSYKHLYERSDDFQLFMYSMRKAFGTVFAQKFPEWNAYLDKCLNFLSHNQADLYQKINLLTIEDYAKTYDPLNAGAIHDNVYILKSADGSLYIPLKKQKTHADNVPVQSDFAIDSNKFVGDKKPLVLQQNHDGMSQREHRPMIYHKNPYQRATQIPHFVSEHNLDNRELPGLTGIKYPFLLISDFLEPYLIRLVYPIHKAKYFDGNVSDANPDGKGYLLPISKTFFDYFDTDFLKSVIPNTNKRVLEMNVRDAERVWVTLRIPIQGDSFVEYTRTYQKTLRTPDASRNEGAMIECQLGVTIYPFLQNPLVKPDYRVLTVDRDISDATHLRKYNLLFYKNAQNTEVKTKAVKERSRKKLRQNEGIEIKVVEDNFDYIQISEGMAQGVLIPNFITESDGAEKFKFAVDFGTTNTHIEYKKGELLPVPFDITAKDLQVGTLHDPEKDIYEGAEALRIVPRQLFPEKMGVAEHFGFPQRTIIAHATDWATGGTDYTLADFNIPFIYEKENIPQHTRTSTNLKWSNNNSQESIQKVRAFFEKLAFMMRSKVLLDGGKLADTELIWFYPSSMTTDRRNRLKAIWKEIWKKYFPKASEPIEISESLAPFYFYKENNDVFASEQPAVSIDIGGGTTDAVIFKSNQPIALTSFRFAANAIFGDAYSKIGSANANGFVGRYESIIRKLLENNQLVELVRVLDGIRLTNRSEDIVTFFFSLENNQEIKNRQLPISFTNILRGDENKDMRFVFVFFYMAIVYHIAQWMKAKEVGMPRYLTFSGNGSRVLNLITDNPKTLEKLTKPIIEAVFGKKYGVQRFEIVRETLQPKEVTCKGGLLTPTDLVDFDPDDIKATLLGGTEAQMVEEDNVKYDRLKPQDLASVVTEVEKFIDIAFEIADRFDFSANLGIEDAHFESYRDMLKSDLKLNLERGLESKRGELTKQSVRLEETLFFYPLIPALKDLAYQIYKGKH